MFPNQLDSTLLDTNSRLFSPLATQLKALAHIEDTQRAGQVTSQAAFPQLYEITKNFYRQNSPDLYRNFVPLYHSVWKHTVHSASGPGNMHQDAGVQYFSRKGYASRMINVWICLDKAVPSELPPDELGVYVVEPQFPENQAIYRKLLEHGIHVTSKSDTSLVDNMQVAGLKLDCKLADLRLTTFPYQTGTMITFSSHLLHGSKSCSPTQATEAGSAPPPWHRIALSSVWLHAEDFDSTLLELPENEFDRLFLWRHDRETWPDLKKYFTRYCEDECHRIADIRRLVKLHLAQLHGPQ